MPVVALAGDTMLGRKVGERLPAPVLAPEVVEIARSADLFVANLECCISERGAPVDVPGKPFFFRAPPVAAELLAEMGVDCVTLANNHVLDFGPVALLDTLEHLRAAGIVVVGAGVDEASARAPVMLGDVRIVAFSDHPRGYAAGADRPGIAYADLAHGVPSWLLDSLGGVTIVSPHWGPNMQPDPVGYVRRAAAELGDATLVAGHSAHVPQGPSGRVLFDLGDFVDDYATHPKLRNDLGLLWLVDLDTQRVEGVPLRLEFCRTRLADPDEAALLLSLMRDRCAAVGSSVERRGDRFVFR
jgi:poly-gamma-glutamate capsule biosynthesis protein CapA/YwtB (metallophosphatase superfamily)